MDLLEYRRLAADGEMISETRGGDAYHLFRVPAGSIVRPYGGRPGVFAVTVPDGTLVIEDVSSLPIWRGAQLGDA